MNLDVKTRDVLTQKIISALETAVQGSTAQLRGSLADGNADAYSDMDILWEVPDDSFPVSVDRIREVLSEAQPVESVRSDPDFQNSKKRRLFFVQFKDLPLFWRADIGVFAQSVQRNFQYDVNNEAARGNDWSFTHSALMNAIAATKAVLRHQDNEARQLLVRGFERIGLPMPEKDIQELILTLTEHVVMTDSSMAGLASQIIALHRQVFGQGGTG